MAQGFGMNIAACVLGCVAVVLASSCWVYFFGSTRVSWDPRDIINKPLAEGLRIIKNDPGSRNWRVVVHRRGNTRNIANDGSTFYVNIDNNNTIISLFRGRSIDWVVSGGALYTYENIGRDFNG